MAYDIGPKIGIDGEAEFRQTIGRINTTLKTMGTEMAAVTSAYAKNDRGAEALTAQNQVLNKQIDTQRQKLAELQRGLDAARGKYGDTDEVTQRWQQTVNKATAELNQMERQLSENNTELNKTESESQQAAVATDKLGDEMAQADRKASSFHASLGRLGAGLKTAAIGTARAAAIGVTAVGTAAIAAGAGIWRMANAAADNADAVQKMSDVTGMSAERIQELKYAGENLGVDLETITGAQSKLTKTMAAAQDGKKGPNAQAKAFEALGISVRDSSGHLRDSKVVMQEALTALGKMKNATERDALAMQLFGKSAMELNPLIKAGGKELARLTDEARKNGAVLSGEQIAALDAFGDSVGALKLSAQGLAGTLSAALLPQLNGLVSMAQGLTVAIGGAVKSGDWSKVGKVLADGLKDAIDMLVGMLPGLLQVGTQIITTLVDAIVKAVPVVVPALMGAVLELVKAAVNILSAQGPTLISVAIEAVGQLIMGLLEALPKLAKTAIQMVLALVNGISKQLPTLIPAAVDAVITIVEALVDNLPMLVDAALQLILALVDGLLTALPKIIEAAPRIITSLVEGIVDALPKLLDAALQIVIALIKALADNYPAIISASVEIVGVIVSGLISAVGKMWEFAPKMWSELWNAVKSLDWGGIGKNMIDGIARGIINSAGAIAKAAREAAQSALNAAKNLLQIHSPSRVMERQVGAQIGAGMAKGITGSGRLIDSAMAGLTDRLALSGVGYPMASTSRVRHSGTLRVEGINDRGQLVDAVQIIIDQMTYEARMA